MGIYLIAFLFSALFYFLAERTEHKYRRWFFALIGILIPSILAGCRSHIIGTDVTAYGISFFERAKSCSGLFDFMEKQMSLGHMDTGFNSIIYFVSLVANDYHWALFVIQLITITVVYIGFCRCNKLFDTPIWFGMLLYYLSLYNFSLNIMRQCIAVAFVFLGATYLFEKRYRIFLVFIAIAFLMHSSALIGLVLLPMHMILCSENACNERKQLIRGIIVIAGILLIFVVANKAVQLLVGIGFLRSNYMEYLAGGKYSTVSTGRGIPKTTLIFQSVYLLIYFAHYRVLNKRRQEALFFTVNSCLVMLISCVAPVFASYVTRVSYYFVPLQMAGFANISSCYSRKNYSRILSVIVLVGILFVTWYMTFVVLGYSETVPYKFFWEN